MVTISIAEPEEVKTIVELKLTEKQIADLHEEMYKYNNKFGPSREFWRIEEYIVFLLEVMDRDVD